MNDRNKRITKVREWSEQKMSKLSKTELNIITILYFHCAFLKAINYAILLILNYITLWVK